MPPLVPRERGDCPDRGSRAQTGQKPSPACGRRSLGRRTSCKKQRSGRRDHLTYSRRGRADGTFARQPGRPRPARRESETAAPIAPKNCHFPKSAPDSRDDPSVSQRPPKVRVASMSGCGATVRARFSHQALSQACGTARRRRHLVKTGAPAGQTLEVAVMASRDIANARRHSARANPGRARVHLTLRVSAADRGATPLRTAPRPIPSGRHRRRAIRRAANRPAPRRWRRAGGAAERGRGDQRGARARCPKRLSDRRPAFPDQNPDRVRPFDERKLDVRSSRKHVVALERAAKAPEAILGRQRPQHDALGVSEVHHDRLDRFAAG